MTVRAVLFDWGGTLSEHREVDLLDVVPDATLTGLAGLLDVVDAWR